MALTFREQLSSNFRYWAPGTCLIRKINACGGQLCCREIAFSKKCEELLAWSQNPLYGRKSFSCSVTNCCIKITTYLTKKKITFTQFCLGSGEQKNKACCMYVRVDRLQHGIRLSQLLIEPLYEEGCVLMAAVFGHREWRKADCVHPSLIFRTSPIFVHYGVHRCCWRVTGNAPKSVFGLQWSTRKSGRSSSFAALCLCPVQSME